MPKVLLVEDEIPLAEGIEYSLRYEGFETAHASDGLKGLELFRTFEPDLILLDLMLPGRSGLEVCQEIRRESNVPIIILTAKGEEADKVMGLAQGADDYVTKPFSTPELIARVRAVLRRSRSAEPQATESLAYGPLQLNLVSRKLRVEGQPVELTRREFDLLEMFMRHPGRVFTRETLLSRVWGEAEFIDDRTVDVHVRWLRQKIEADPSRPALIQTVRSVGYRFGE
ncbi:MAG: response regulator transcription factor [Armatimonadetes bacterium]|nr:response regulator transcription factor [Armatimonadota bacterium]